MNKNLTMQQNNVKLQHLLEAALDFAMLITNGDQGKFEVFRRALLNKYNALKKSNPAEFQEEMHQDIRNI